MSSRTSDIGSLITQSRLDDLKRIEYNLNDEEKKQQIFDIKKQEEQDVIKLDNLLTEIDQTYNELSTTLREIIKTGILISIKNDLESGNHNFLNSTGELNISLGVVKENINKEITNYEQISSIESVGKDVITLWAFDKLIDNFDKLTQAERENLLNNYNEMNYEQQRRIDKQVANRFKKMVSKLSSEEQEILESQIQLIERNIQEVSEIDELIELFKNPPTDPAKIKRKESLSQKYPQFITEDGLDETLAIYNKGTRNKNIDSLSEIMKEFIAVIESPEGSEIIKKFPNAFIDGKLDKKELYRQYFKKNFGKHKIIEVIQSDNNLPTENVVLEKAEETIDSMSGFLDFGLDELKTFEVEVFPDSPTHQTEISAKLKTPVDTDLVQKELSAVAFATAKANASPEAIREGMQAYKDIISGLSLDELQGKSDDEVLKILQQKSAELGLRGDAGEILGIMSQIGFKSQDGQEPQIATLLTEYRDEFVGVIEEASKEENIERAQNDAKNHALISDVEAQYGLEALQVDLEVAEIKISTDKTLDSWVEKPSEVEEIGNNASDTDTGAVAGSTSSGKPMMQSILTYLKESKGITSSELQEQTDLLGKLAEEQNKDVTREGDEQAPEQEEYTT